MLNIFNVIDDITMITGVKHVHVFVVSASSF